MNKQIIISDYLVPLQQYGKTGIVHSVFDRSFNLKIQDQLIHISNFSNYLSSFGIFLPNEVFQSLKSFVQQGNIVKLTAEQLTIYSKWGVQTVVIVPRQIVSLKITDFHLKSSQLRLLREHLSAQKLTGKIGLPVDQRAMFIFEQLQQASAAWTQSQWQEIVNYLIGRGQGLTPSGDDILVAYQTILSAVGDERGAALNAALATAKWSTTDISRAYIESSAQGYGNSLIYQLLADLAADKKTTLDKNVENILKIGHSSGVDLSFGMLLALQTIEREKK
ncbi:DUF2877 domain-containing protein [Enterococcus faecalis]